MLWLAGGQVLDVRTWSWRRADLALDGDRIVDAVPRPPGGGRGGRRRGHRVLRADDLFLVPGLIDCHVHLVMRAEDADPAAIAPRPDPEVAAHAARAAERTLRAGITSVRDLGGWNHLEMELRRAIERGEAAGPRLFLAGRLISAPTPAAGYYPGMYEVAAGAAEVQAAVGRQVAAGADVIKVMATGAMLSPEEEDARQVQLGPGELRAAVEAAVAAGRPVAAHAHAREGIRHAVEAGVASVEHGTFADRAALRAMAVSGTFLVPTLEAAEAPLRHPEVLSALPPHLRARLTETREVHLEAVRTAHRLGVPIAMGTDAGTPGNHHGENAHECVDLVERVGMTPAESLAAATVRAARLLGQEGRLGTLDPGARADVVGLPEDPLSDIRALTRVALVVRAGVPVPAASP